MAQGYINDRMTDYESLKSRLMGRDISPQRSDHFDVLNHHLRRGLVTPGQLVVVPDSYSVTCSMEEAWLMRHAEKVRWELGRDKLPNLEVVGEGHVYGLGAGSGRGGVGDQGGVCGRARGAVSADEVCGDGEVGGAHVGGKLGARLARGGCRIFMGIAAKGNGALACAVIGGAAGGYAGGKALGTGGAFLGGQIVEIDGDLIFQPEGA